MQTGHSTIGITGRAYSRREKGIIIVSAAVLIALIMVSFCIRDDTADKSVMMTSPSTFFKNIATYLKLQFLSFTSPEEYKIQNLDVQDLPYYYENVHRFSETFTIAIAGAILAASGAVFQCVMRNPLAEPAMLGVQSGVNLGCAFVVINTGLAFTSTARYFYCYLFAFIVVAAVLICGRLAGGKKTSVVDMILGGVIINRVMNGINATIRFSLDEDQLIDYQTLTKTPYLADISLAKLGIFILVAVICILPGYMMRFSFNTMAFGEEGTMSLGINPKKMQIVGIVSGAVLFTTAMIFCGTVGLVSLLIPHMCRFLFGADFKKVLFYSALFGAIFLLASRIIAMFVYFSNGGFNYQVPLPLAIFIVMLLPFIWVMAKQKRGVE